ncbi:hypothetical protein H4R33_004197 [Dimargaris cristalligena]|nr:hypothetical protein H4R33_004197 [Dimargaris cristalligena]
MHTSYATLLSLALATAYTAGGSLPPKFNIDDPPLDFLQKGLLSGILLNPQSEPEPWRLSIIFEESDDEHSTFGGQRPQQAVEGTAPELGGTASNKYLQLGGSRETIYYDALDNSAFPTAPSSINTQPLDDHDSSDEESIHPSTTTTPSTLRVHFPANLAGRRSKDSLELSIREIISQLSQPSSNDAPSSSQLASSLCPAYLSPPITSSSSANFDVEENSDTLAMPMADNEMLEAYYNAQLLNETPQRKSTREDRRTHTERLNQRFNDFSTWCDRHTRAEGWHGWKGRRKGWIKSQKDKIINSRG